MRTAFAFAVVVTLLLLVGCNSLQYTGAAPSARTFHDDPRPDDYYYGADARFTVAAPGERLRPAAAVPDRDPLDLWNAPISWNPDSGAITHAPAVANTPADLATGN